MPRRCSVAILILALHLSAASSFSLYGGESGSLRRPPNHQQFAERFWNYLHDKYRQWETLSDLPESVPLPDAGLNGVVLANPPAAASQNAPKYGSIFVVEHQRQAMPYAVTALFRAREGVNAKNDDWYELFYLLDGTPVKTSADRAPYDRPGFYTRLIDGRLWVARLDSPHLAEIVAGDVPEKHVTRVGAGPGRITLKAEDPETLNAYLLAKPGFVTQVIDGRGWVFVADSPGAHQALVHHLPEKHVTRIGVGPNRMTLKAADRQTLDAYLCGKRGFDVVNDDDGRLWVFRSDSEAWRDYQKKGLPEKHVTRIGAGPRGETLKGESAETLIDYIVAQPGFSTKIVDGRLWVVRIDDPQYETFHDQGHLEKHVTRVGGGPLGMTIKSPDLATMDAYMKHFPLRSKP